MKKLGKMGIMTSIAAILLVAAFAFSACGGGYPIPNWVNDVSGTPAEIVQLLKDNGYADAALNDDEDEIRGTKIVDGKNYKVSISIFADKDKAAMNFFMGRAMVQGLLDYANWTELDDEDMEVFKSLNFSLGSDNITASGKVDGKEVGMFAKLSGKYLITEQYGEFDLESIM